MTLVLMVLGVGAAEGDSAEDGYDVDDGHDDKDDGRSGHDPASPKATASSSFQQSQQEL